VDGDFVRMVAATESIHVARPNVHLYAGPLYTQADVDAMIPHLLRCPAAVRGLVITPREEIRLDQWLYRYRSLVSGLRYSNPKAAGKHEAMPCFNHVVIRGHDKPLHPEHVRGIIAQCEAADVPVWFDGWGEWLPECEPSPLGILGTMDYGYPIHEWVDDGGWYSHRVGRARSGAMLDGKEWRQLPEVKG
jgi:hypothetical protein